MVAPVCVIDDEKIPEITGAVVSGGGGVGEAGGGELVEPMSL